MSHVQLRFAVLLLLSGFLTQITNAQDDVKPENRDVTAKDGWPIHFTYYPSNKGKDASVVVLIHGLDGQNRNRVEWDATRLAAQLSKAEFAVIAVDLRKHGDSKAPEDAPARIRNAKVTKNDYIAMVSGDLEAIKKFIFNEHQNKKLNMKKTAIVAADASSVIAMNFTALDWLKKPHDDSSALATKTPRGQDVQAVVLLSPQEALTGMNTSKPLKLLRRVGLASLLIYGEKNKTDSRAAIKFYKQLGGENQNEAKPRIYQAGYNSNLRGINLMKIKGAPNSPGPSDYIIGFLKNHLGDIEIPWKNRESRLTRPKEDN